MVSIQGPDLRGRRRECETLDRLLREVRAGTSRVLVLRGEAGVGKTSLLEFLAERASGTRVIRASGVESESEIAYSALQQLCSPLLEGIDALPEPQRDALATAFGLTAGPPPQALIVGLAVLGLLSEAAAERPLVGIIDDAQWVDRMSEVVLTFVARRLEAESVGLVFAARHPGDDRLLVGLPELRVLGLAEADARALLDSVLTAPVEPGVRDRIIAETRGNPLALIELPRGLTAAELAFGFGGHMGVTLANRLEQGFQRQIMELPPDTRRLLLTAAVEPVGDVTLLWRALERLGVSLDAAASAEAVGLIELGARVRFRHPLVRSAAWRSADGDEVRTVHHALAEAIDPTIDPDRRAWHRAHAAIAPDEQVAAELERSADRALARGGRSAAASFLERAAELTPDPTARGARLVAAAQARFDAGSPRLVPELLAAAELMPIDASQRAHAERMRAQVAFAVNPGREAGPLLLAAATRLEELDPTAARHTYLSAIGAAVHAGRLGGDALHRAATTARRAEAARSESRGDAPPETTFDLLLAALTSWALDGYAAAAPELQRALAEFTDDESLSLLWLGAPVAHEIWDDAAWFALSERAVAFARATGTLGLLPTALAFRAGTLAYAGRFADAIYVFDEADVAEQTSGLAPRPSGRVALAAFRGRESEAIELITTVARDATARGEGRLLASTAYARAVLYNGLSRYPAALEAARQAVEYDDLAMLNWSLGELVEAAMRAGEPGIATGARDRLAERTSAATTSWAKGAQALADALVGASDGADERYREAIERLGETHLALHLARARLLYGEWLRRSNRRAEARSQLRAAHEAFATMGAEAFAARAARELVATGETVRRAAGGGEPELTSQEAEIARLAVAGQTNPEIGAKLFLSPRTVEWHLGKVFTKLGVGSRRELATALPAE
jgi:DNA-binding CsgD family transcriptional regulator